MKERKNMKRRSLGSFFKWAGISLFILSVLFTVFIYVFLDPLVKHRIIKGVNNASNGLYHLEIGDLNAKFWSGAIHMDDVWLRPNKEVLHTMQAMDTSSSIPDVNLFLDTVSISSINWIGYLMNNNKLEIGKVRIYNPDFIITTEVKEKSVEVRKGNQNFLELLPGIIAAFTGSLRIEEIIVERGSLHYDLISDNGTIHQLADSVFIDLQRIRIDTLSRLNALYSEKAFFYFHNYRLESSDNQKHFRIEMVEGNIHDETIRMKNLQFFHKDVEGHSPMEKFRVHVDEVDGRGVNYRSLFNDRKIFLQTMELKEPDIKLITNKQFRENKTPKSDDESSILDQLVPYLSGSFQIDTLAAKNGKINYLIKDQKKEVHQKAERINLLFTRVLVDTLKTGSKVFAEDIDLSLKNYLLRKDRDVELKIDDFRASLKDSLFDFNEIKFINKSTAKSEINAKRLTGKKVDFRSAFEKRKLRAGSLSIIEPDIRVSVKLNNHNSTAPSKKKNNTGMSQSFYNMLGDFSDLTLDVKRFSIDNAEVIFTSETQKGKVDQKASKLNLEVNGIHIDSSQNYVYDFYKCFNLSMEDYKVNVHSSNFTVGVGKVFARSNQKKLQLDKVEITQIHSFKDTQRTYFVNTIEFAEASGLDFNRFVNKQEVHAQNFLLDQMNLRIFLNSGKPERPDYVTKMPNHLIQDLPFYLRIDTFDLKNSKVVYENEDAAFAEIGKLSFEKIWGHGVNITNDCKITTKENPASFEAHTMLMGEGDLNFYIQIPLMTKELNGSYGGYLGAMEAQTFNNFLSFIGVRVERGLIDSSRFHVNINNGSAEGNLLLLYNNLKIKVIDPQTLEASRFKSVIGNFIVKNSNPKKEDKEPEVVELSSELEEGDGFFFLFVEGLEGWCCKNCYQRQIF